MPTKTLCIPADEFLRTYKKAQGTPQTKFEYPQTEAQEIGWDTRPLVSTRAPHSSPEPTCAEESMQTLITHILVSVM